MKILVFLAGVVLLLGACAGGQPHWGYSGDEGPAHWGELSPDFTACSEGKNQSPIDLTGFVEADLKPIAFSYQVGAEKIVNNGHTIQVNYASGSMIIVDGHAFELKQYHFHTPSENHINNASYPMEAHLVHADKDGNLAVIAVMFLEGAENEAIAQAWAKMPKKTGEESTLSAEAAAVGLLPADRDYYRFNGSLTTPPCSEGVWWFVMKATMTVSKEQIEQFSEMMHHPNNRPVQAVNARPVLQ